MENENKCHQNIECDVESCKFNDCDCHHCELEEIKVSCNCSNDDATKSETICDSFEEREDLEEDDDDDDDDDDESEE